MIIYVRTWQVSWLHPEKRLPISGKKNSGLVRIAFHQTGFTVAGTASDSITEFPFIQAEKGCLYHQIGHKVGNYFIYVLRLMKKWLLLKEVGDFEP